MYEQLPGHARSDDISADRTGSIALRCLYGVSPGCRPRRYQRENAFLPVLNGGQVIHLRYLTGWRTYRRRAECANLPNSTFCDLVHRALRMAQKLLS